jgi:outer membrane usher protein FimD/PapC
MQDTLTFIFSYRQNQPVLRVRVRQPDGSVRNYILPYSLCVMLIILL